MSVRMPILIVSGTAGACAQAAPATTAAAAKAARELHFILVLKSATRREISAPFLPTPSLRAKRSILVPGAHTPHRDCFVAALLAMTAASATPSPQDIRCRSDACTPAR